MLPTIERVLCALDVEQPVLDAVSLANLIAMRFKVPLEVLHVESGAKFRPFESNADRVETLMATHNAGERLDQLVQGHGNPDSTTTKLVAGQPVASILERTGVSGNELIVLGARQRSDLGWQFRDDIARQVSALAQCATLTVHDRDRADKIERILVPVDLGPVTARAVAWACLFAQRFSAHVHLLHVASRERGGQPSSRVAELVQGLERSGVRASGDVTIAAGVVEGITACNDRGLFDLLVLGLNGPPQGPPRLSRGLAPTLRSRMSIPVLSLREVTHDSPISASGAR